MLGGGIPSRLKNMSSSVGMMTFPTEWKNKKCSKLPVVFSCMMNYTEQKDVTETVNVGMKQETNI